MGVTEIRLLYTDNLASSLHNGSASPVIVVFDSVIVSGRFAHLIIHQRAPGTAQEARSCGDIDG